mgnify:CR=1 FL=1
MKKLKGSSLLKKEEVLKRKIIEIEMDYELLTLFDAMQEGNEGVKEATIKRLKDLRKELISLNF